MKRILFSVFAVALISFFSACSESSDKGGTGQLVIKVTDAPFPIDMIESATVTITKVEIRKVCDTICDGNPYIIVL